MTNTTIPKRVVSEDHRLEKLANRSQEDLAAHRWHQTLDSKGPGYSIRAYATAVGRAQSTILQYAQGYADWYPQRDAPGCISLSDCMIRTRMTGDKLEATEAVAQARGVSLKTVQGHYRPEVDRTIQSARERVESVPGTTMPEAIRTVAKENETIRQATRHQQMSEPLVYVKITKDLIEARRKLTDALEHSRNHNLDSAWIDLLIHAVDQVQATLDLVRVAIAGTATIDWDAELRKLSAI
jgi:hypothetical protein